MSGEGEYSVWRGWPFTVVLCVRSDFLGAGYRFLRNDWGIVRRFWTRKAAQAVADKLNRGEVA